MNISHLKPTVFVLMLILLLGGAVVAFSEKFGISKPVACTTEAMICPDGSAVGRTGPKCEFAPCPTISSTTPNDGTGDEGDPDSTVVIRQSDDRQIVHVPIDQYFRIEFSNLKWNFTFSNPQLVKEIHGMPMPTGAQALFQAIGGGTTTLTAIGAPDCRPGEMCAQFLVNFETTIVIDK